MSIILKTPDICSFSKNSMLFKVKAEQMFDKIDVFPKVRISFTSEPSIGRYFSFDFRNPETLEMENIYVKTFLYVEGEGQIIGSSSSDLATATDNWIDGLKKVPVLNAFYSVIRIDDGIIDIQAKFSNEDLIPLNVDENLTGNFGFGVEVNNFFVEASEREGYELKALVYYNDPKINVLTGEQTSFDWDLVAVEYLAPDSNGEAFFDVCEIIDSKIEADQVQLPIPPYENSIIHSKSLIYYAPNLKQYAVVFVESWLDGTEEISTKSENLFVHWGGISVDDEINDSAVNHVIQRQSFLTWYQSKTIDINQPDWIWWMNNSIRKNIRLVLKIQTDVQSYTFTVRELAIDSFQTIGIKAMINEYLNNIDTQDLIEINPGENIVWFEFSIEEFYDSAFGDPVANFTYYFVNDFCNKHYIVFINPFGVPETFSTKSDWEENTEVSKEIASRGLNYNNSHLRSKSFAFNPMHQNSYQVASDPMNREHVKRLQSILNSTETFVIEKGKYIPVIISNVSASVWSNSRFLASLEFELLKANMNEKPSFFDSKPSIDVSADGYGWKFKLKLNGFDFNSATDLAIKDENGDLIKTLNFSEANFAWLNSCTAANWDTESLPEGIILFSTTIQSKNGTTVELKGIYKITYLSTKIYWDGGILSANTLTFGSYSVITSDVKLLYNIQQTQPIFTTVDIHPTVNIVSNYTTPGNKYFTLKSTSFQDVNFFESIGNDIKKIKLTDFKNLVNLNLQNSTIEGTLLLNQNQELQNINIVQSTMTMIEFGYMPKLDILALQDLTNLDELALETIMKQLWNYRKAYLNHVDIYLINLVTPTAETLDLINGTGEYAGDGLVNNDITVFII